MDAFKLNLISPHYWALLSVLLIQSKLLRHRECILAVSYVEYLHGNSNINEALYARL